MRKPNHERRLARVTQRTQSATSLFEAAAFELEQAAEEANSVAVAAEAEMDNLETVRHDATIHAVAASAKAQKIREFVQ